MARGKATTKGTGGGGFTYADKIAAGFFTKMLRRDLFLGADRGPITAVDFETSESGNSLDDLQLTLQHEQLATRLFTSVKSNRQLTTAGFNSEFVADAWEQWANLLSRDPFDPERDLLGLTVEFVDEVALYEWTKVHRQAVDTTAQRLVDRLVPENQSNETQRDIFESLRGTESNGKRDAIETAQLATRIRLFPFSEEDEGEYVNLCSEMVADGSLLEAGKLWDRLLRIAAASRGTGAHYDLPKLLSKVRPDFELRDYPDYAADWTKLETISADNLAHETRTTLGNGIHLPRAGAEARLLGGVDKNSVVVVVGESGSGKSALVSKVAKPGYRFRRTLGLTAGQLSKPSQVEVAQSLRLRHTVPDLIAGSALRECVLVVDGFEQFDGDSRKNVIRIIKQLNEQKFEYWKAIVTCQPHTLPAVRDALIEAGVAEFERVDFEKPKVEEILMAVDSVPAIKPLLLRKELQPILRNLMILDWVIREDVAHRIPASEGWVGETQIVDLIWDRWTGGDPKRLARDGLMRELGKREGDRLTGAVHIDSLPLSHMELLGELEQKGLIRTDGGQIRFYHDLMGDWARYRSLRLAGSDIAAQIKGLAKVPRWGRAIRLYAQSLAEGEGGLNQWRVLATALAGEDADAQVARDLLLDALLFAPNSETLLEQVWGDLVADQGQDLQRLLKRLLYVASVPDWRLEGLADANLAENARAWFRIPHPLYWYPVLRVMARHSPDIVKLARSLGAQVCALWLRTMPHGTFGRSEASQIAVDLARELQGRLAAGGHLDKKAQEVFEALLYAAPDRPDEVERMALELSGRRPEPRYAIEWAADEHDRQERAWHEWKEKHPDVDKGRKIMAPGATSFRQTRLIPAETEGPQRRVSVPFRSAALSTPALAGLIAARPEAAKEIVIALSIHEPREVSRSGDMDLLRRDELGLADWPDGNPALPWKGPFLTFLQAVPEQGLDTIVRLVNYATTKWLQGQFDPNPTDEQRKERCLDLKAAGANIFWVGDINVFGWNRLYSSGALQVECALMALEQWFDSEVQNGRSIEPWVKYLFEHGESIAFAGVLVSVGQKYPMLFAKELQPLLGNFYLYGWQQELAVAEEDKLWIFSLANLSPEVIAYAVKWHDQRYRRCLLRDIGTWLMHQDEGTHAYLLQRRTAWASEIKAEGKAKEEFDFFLARFDPQNYTETPTGDGCVEISMQWPAGLQAIATQSLEASNEKSLAMGMAWRARRLLDGEEVLGEEKLQEFVSQLRQLVTWRYPAGEESDEHYRISSVAGALAVLIVQHRSWLALQPDLEKWLFDTLRELKPTVPEHESPHVKTGSAAGSFLGEIAIALLVESKEEWIYRLAFEAVTAANYDTTLHTMWRAYQLRDDLGGTFIELLNVVVLWSALRRAGSRHAGPYANHAVFAKQRPALFARFLSGRLNKRIPLKTAEHLARGLAERVERATMEPSQREWQRLRKQQKAADTQEVSREIPDLDIEVLRKGFGFLQVALTESAIPQPIFTDIFREVFDLEMATLPTTDPDKGFRELRDSPYDFDNWVMTLAAVRIAHANSIETAREFYRPILNIGPVARYWVAKFLQAWIVSGLPLSKDRAGFVRIWQDMMAYVDPLPDWQPGSPGCWCPAEILAPELAGIDEAAVAVLGKATYRPVVEAMAPTFEAWGNRWLGYASVAQWYANFLTTESGEAVLAPGIRQLAKVTNSFTDDGWNRYELGVLLAAALSKAWANLRADIELDVALREAFLKLLAAVCARNVSQALNLRAMVTEVLTIPS
jgi:hypothetical protein